MRNSKLKTRNYFLKPQASSVSSAFHLSSSPLTPHPSRLFTAFTMVEVLIVVAILALLVAVLLGVSNFINTQKNTALTENCLVILDAALGEFYAITGHYPVDDWGNIGDPGSLIAGANSGGTPEPDELLYLQLSILPQTRDIIAKLPEKLLTAPHDGITVQLADQPGLNTPYLRRIVDAWGNPLDYFVPASGFPVISSFGPDGLDDGGGNDDITNED